jgi:hypothetical protein
MGSVCNELSNRFPIKIKTWGDDVIDFVASSPQSEVSSIPSGFVAEYGQNTYNGYTRFGAGVDVDGELDTAGDIRTSGNIFMENSTFREFTLLRGGGGVRISGIGGEGANISGYLDGTGIVSQIRLTDNLVRIVTGVLRADDDIRSTGVIQAGTSGSPRGWGNLEISGTGGGSSLAFTDSVGGSARIYTTGNNLHLTRGNVNNRGIIIDVNGNVGIGTELHLPINLM